MGQQHRAAAYLLPDPTEGNLSTRTEGRLYPFGYFWEIWCESNTIFFSNIIILGNIVIRISGKFGAGFRVKCYSVALRLPYLLGTLCHHEGQALADGAAAPGSSLQPARSYGG